MVLKAEKTAFSADLPLDVQSISSSGLVVLSANQIPMILNSELSRVSEAEEGTPLRFVAEVGERKLPLKARLVWLDLSGNQTDNTPPETVQPRLELIVDTAEEPGWQELHDLLAQPVGH